MEKDIIDGKIGAVGAYDLEFKEGELRFVVKISHLGMIAELKLGIGADQVLDALAKATDTPIDDAIYNVIKQGLKLPM